MWPPAPHPPALPPAWATSKQSSGARQHLCTVSRFSTQKPTDASYDSAETQPHWAHPWASNTGSSMTRPGQTSAGHPSQLTLCQSASFSILVTQETLSAMERTFPSCTCPPRQKPTLVGRNERWLGSWSQRLVASHIALPQSPHCSFPIHG